VSFAIIRGRNGRRHEVDFGDAAIEVDVAIGSEPSRSRSKPSGPGRQGLNLKAPVH
jgi:hypothetical protein